MDTTATQSRIATTATLVGRAAQNVADVVPQVQPQADQVIALVLRAEVEERAGLPGAAIATTTEALWRAGQTSAAAGSTADALGRFAQVEPLCIALATTIRTARQTLVDLRAGQ